MGKLAFMSVLFIQWLSQCPWQSNFYISIKTTPQALLQRSSIIAVTLQFKKKADDESLKGTFAFQNIHRKSVPQKKSQTGLEWHEPVRDALAWCDWLRNQQPTGASEITDIISPARLKRLISGTRLVNLYSLNTEGWDKHQTNLMF